MGNVHMKTKNVDIELYPNTCANVYEGLYSNSEVERRQPVANIGVGQNTFGTGCRVARWLVLFVAVLGAYGLVLTLHFAVRENTVEKHAVAFTATLSRSINLTRPDEVIKYDFVISNVGNSYDPATGKFTAPYSGIYSISASMMTKPEDDGHKGHLNIVKNGNLLATLYTSGPTYELASHTMNVPCEKGDMIWVRNRSAKDLHDNHKERYNIFSAALIAEGEF